MIPTVTPGLQSLVEAVARLLHAGRKVEAAKLVLDVDGRVHKTPRNDNEALEPLWTFLHFLLDRDNYEQAASLLWTPTMFTAEPDCTRRVWKTVRESSSILLMGASSMSKTYGCGVYYFLDWLRDPEFTTVKVLGPSEDHLQNNLFSHLVNLHNSASLPMPGRVGDLFIGLDLRNRRSAITGVVVPLGRKAAGRLQGSKRFPRSIPHPRFGALSRLRVLLDEFEKIPGGIHSDIDNLMSTVEGTDGLKIVGAYNPQDVNGKIYQLAEPVKGWAAVDMDKDFNWVSKRGWSVVRLDGEQSENVAQNRVIFPGLQTREGLDKLASNSGGRMSPGYYTFGRAMYPPQGTIMSVIPQNLVTHLKAQFIWLGNPLNIGAVDSSLEGGDPAVFAHGQWGLATGIQYPASLEFPAGHTEFFKDTSGTVIPRHGLQLTQLFNLEKGKTVEMARQIREAARKLGVLPQHLLLDRTGNGAGVHDLLQEIWAPEVRGVNYAESATHTKVLLEDTKFCDELYHLVYSELWFAARKWFEFGVFKVAHAVPTEALYHQLTSREYPQNFQAVARERVEAKRDWKHRNEGKSPNEADAVTLLIHCCRMTSGVTPGMSTGERRAEETGAAGDILLPRVDTTNRLDDIDSEGRRNGGWPSFVNRHEDPID